MTISCVSYRDGQYGSECEFGGRNGGSLHADLPASYVLPEVLPSII